jgi:hypothetical protein
MRNIGVALLCSIISLAAVAAWYYAAGADNSQWILIVAYIAAFGVLSSIKKTGFAAVAALSVAAGSGAAWYLHRSADFSGWVLGLCIFTAICVVCAISPEPKKKTQKK